jgi:hypothetical protein
MKRILLLLFAASAFLGSCGVPRITPEEQHALVDQAVKTLDMTIDITEVYRGHNVNKEYSITMDGKHITTRLPFYGQTRYGGLSELSGNVSIHLENAEVFNVHLDQSKLASKGQYLLSFQARNDAQTLYTFNITLFDNGQADILVSTTNKTSMRYLGEMSFENRK